jgi:hypothetical protein
VPLSHGELFQGTRTYRVPARVGHQDVDGPKTLLDGLAHGGHLVVVGEVAWRRQRRAACRLDPGDHGGHGVSLAAVDRNGGALGREEHGDGGADTA